MARPERIVVVRALPGLGDMLCLAPALRGIRAGAPDAAVTVIGHPRGRWFGDRHPELVDGWIDLPWWPGIVECQGTFDDLVAFVDGWSDAPDVFVQLHGSGRSINWLAEPLRAARTIVHVPADDEVAERWTVWRPWPDTGHEIDRLCDLVELAGWPVPHRDLVFAPHDEEVARADSLLGSQRLAVVHPGASRADRCWSVEGFANVARRIAGDVDAVWVTAGPDEQSLAAAVCSAAACARVRAAPPMTIGVMAAVLARSAVAVANDTGVAHLSVAVGCPTVVVGTTSDTDRWGPRDRVRHRVVRVAPSAPGPAAWSDDAGRVVAAASAVLVSGR